MQKLSQAPAVANTSSRLTQLGLRSSCSKCCSTLRGLLTKSEEGRLAPVHATLQALGCQNLADVNQDLWGNHNLLHSPEAHKHLSVWLIHYLDHEKHKKKAKVPSLCTLMAIQKSLGRVCSFGQCFHSWCNDRSSILHSCAFAFSHMQVATSYSYVEYAQWVEQREQRRATPADSWCAVYPSDREIYQTRRQCYNVPTLESKPKVLACQTCKKLFHSRGYIFTVDGLRVSQTSHWSADHSLAQPF